MDKKIFLYVLQAALLNFDGVDINELVGLYGIPESFARAGINLCLYLKSIRLENEIKEKKEDLITSKFSQFPV